MNNRKKALIAFAAVSVLAGISVFLLQTKKTGQPAGFWRKKRRGALSMMHEIREGFSEELEGLKGRMHGAHWKRRKQVPATQKATK